MVTHAAREAEAGAGSSTAAEAAAEDNEALVEQIHHEEILEQSVTTVDELRRIKRWVATLAILALFTACYFARDVILPIVMALFLTLTLRPVVRGAERWHIPPVVSGTGIFLLVALGFVVVGLILADPVRELVVQGPEIQMKLQDKLGGILHGLSAVQELQDNVGEVANAGEPEPQTVVVDNSGLLPEAVGSVASIGASLIAALVLTMFLLASGDLFLRRIIEVSPSIHEKKKALIIVRDVERQVSRYLGAISMINAGLGICIGVAMWALGMPTPLLWGVVGFLFNYVPYVGAISGVVFAGAIATVTFDDTFSILLPPLTYFALTTIEGQFVTPSLVGRQLEMNTAAVFITVVFWIWLWGVPGAILAVPFLVVLKVIADNVGRLRPIGRFLAGEGG